MANGFIPAVFNARRVGVRGERANERGGEGRKERGGAFKVGKESRCADLISQQQAIRAVGIS
jgi:hypothetical protein